MEGPQIRAGESWTRGVVVLAWDHVKRESFRTHGGRNVVLHEFAHQLDQEDGIANAPQFFPIDQITHPEHSISKKLSKIAKPH